MLDSAAVGEAHRLRGKAELCILDVSRSVCSVGPQRIDGVWVTKGVSMGNTNVQLSLTPWLCLISVERT